MVAEFVFSVEHINNEVIVKAQSGTAPGIAAAIDAADMPEIVATIAGNDTVLGICRSEEKAVAAEGMIKKLQHPDGKSKLMGDRREGPAVSIPEDLRESGDGTAPASSAAAPQVEAESPAEAEAHAETEEPAEVGATDADAGEKVVESDAESAEPDSADVLEGLADSGYSEPSDLEGE